MNYPANYHSLDGSHWRFRELNSRRWYPATVPGCVHTDLERAGVIADPFKERNEFAQAWIEEKDWLYETVFTVPDSFWEHEHLELVAGGLDTVAEVVLNGVEIGRSENMFVAHRWAVRDRLRKGKNRLQVLFRSPSHYIRTQRQEHTPREINDPIGGCTRIRKQQCSFGWDWGPRLPTSGIWQSIGLHAWSTQRLISVKVTQHHQRGRVRLTLAPELARDAGVECSFRSVLSDESGKKITSDGLELEVIKPRLWWPNGQGDASLYTLSVECLVDGKVIDVWSRRIGLRTIELDRSRDRWGESFQFKVNGRAIFAKGANWIPVHALPMGVSRADYVVPLQAAADANMNMIRLWGGGIYEHEAFYDLCDELGLLVWQDFMFACTLYPGDAAFLQSVKEEANQQVVRIRHRASLALWCGNNEIESLNLDALKGSTELRRNYDAVFNELLPAVVKDHDGATPYWASSPQGSQNEGAAKDAAELTGDWHDWDVWHARHPVKAYEKSHARFVSEFGMQSWPSEETAKAFCPANELNVYSPAIEARQKNPSGNAIMADYIARRYRFASDYGSMAYLSQLNQAYCMKVAVEHWRRSQPRTMGALYWQLNDVWPSISWSSLEFGGHWKPVHHAARRFFAPVLLSAHVRGDESRGIGNRLKSDIQRVDLFTVSDHPSPVSAVVAWELWLWSEGRIIRKGKESVTVVPGEARCREELDFSKEIAAHGREQLLLRLRLKAKGFTDAEDVVLFTAPRHLDLQFARISVKATREDSGRWRLQLLSPVYQHGVVLDLPGTDAQWDDNCFDLLPGVTREVTVSVSGFSRAWKLVGALKTRSLVDTYQPGKLSRST